MKNILSLLRDSEKRGRENLFDGSDLRTGEMIIPESSGEEHEGVIEVEQFVSVGFTACSVPFDSCNGMFGNDTNAGNECVVVSISLTQGMFLGAFLWHLDLGQARLGEGVQVVDRDAIFIHDLFGYGVASQKIVGLLRRAGNVLRQRRG